MYFRQRISMTNQLFLFHSEAVVRRCSVNKVFLKILQNSQENTCDRVSFLIKLQAEVSNFIQKETLKQVLSCEFCEISKNTFFPDHLRATASVHYYLPSRLRKYHLQKRRNSNPPFPLNIQLYAITRTSFPRVCFCLHLEKE